MKAACFSVAAMDYFPALAAHFPGGNALNQALRFRQIGHESAFIGAIGDDLAGERILALLQAQGVDVSRCCRRSGRTASNQIINDAQGERFGVEGAWDNGVYHGFVLGEEDWALAGGCEVWATHANGVNFDEALARKTTAHCLAVDFLHFTTYELLEKGRHAIDIAYFGGTPDMAEDLQRLSSQQAGVIVLTLGAQGSMAFAQGKAWHQAALPLDRVLDTTGCGDAFQAAFTAHFYDTKNIAGALLAGASLGREAASHHGGVAWA